MKKTFIMALAAAILCGCEKEIMSESTAANDDATTVSDGSPVGTKEDNGKN